MRTTTSASCSTASGAAREAALCFSKVITLRPKHPEARRLLALAHYTLGEVDKAIEVFDEWLREEPDDPIARHMLAACSGRDVPARASDAFIETTFDSFAASFDAKLASLAYRAPALVAEMLARAGVDASRSLDVARRRLRHRALRTARRAVRTAPGRGRPVRGDARPRARAERLRRAGQARADRVPARLPRLVRRDRVSRHARLLRPARRGRRGRRERAASRRRPRLHRRGTLRHRDEAGYSLSPNGRYRHTPGYVERVLADAGLQSEIVPAELRLEAGEPVAGLVVRSTAAQARL